MAINTHTRTVRPRPELFRDETGFTRWLKVVKASGDIQAAIDSNRSERLIPVLNRLIRASIVSGERPQYRVPHANVDAEDYTHRLKVKARKGLAPGSLSMIGVELVSDQYPSKDEVVPGPEAIWGRRDTAPTIIMPTETYTYLPVSPDDPKTAPYWVGFVKAIGTAEAVFCDGQTGLIAQ